jgi:hypothetical protein
MVGGVNPLSRVDSQKSKRQPYRQPRRQPHLHPRPKCGHNVTADNIPSLLEYKDFHLSISTTFGRASNIRFWAGLEPIYTVVFTR